MGVNFKAIDHLPARTIFQKAMRSLEETRNPISLGINAQGHTIKSLGIHTQLRYVRIVAVINSTSVFNTALTVDTLKGAFAHKIQG